MRYVVFNEGVLVDHEKIKIVIRCPIPKDKNEVREFSVLVIYSRKYVRDLSRLQSYNKFVK
jgi:hypothetical protein